MQEGCRRAPAAARLYRGVLKESLYARGCLLVLEWRSIQHEARCWCSTWSVVVGKIASVAASRSACCTARPTSQRRENRAFRMERSVAASRSPSARGPIRLVNSSSSIHAHMPCQKGPPPTSAAQKRLLVERAGVSLPNACRRRMVEGHAYRRRCRTECAC